MSPKQNMCNYFYFIVNSFQEMEFLTLVVAFLRKMSVCVCTCACAHASIHPCKHVRGQPGGVVSLLPPLCGFQGLNYTLQLAMESAFTCEPSVSPAH